MHELSDLACHQLRPQTKPKAMDGTGIEAKTVDETFIVAKLAQDFCQHCGGYTAAKGREI